MGSSPTRGNSFFLGKVTALGVLCYFSLFVCLTLLASFFIPSHLSFKNICTCICLCQQVKYKYMFVTVICRVLTARMYSNQTVGFLLQKMEVAQEKVRVPTLEIIKHIINSCGE